MLFVLLKMLGADGMTQECVMKKLSESTYYLQIIFQTCDSGQKE